MLGEAVLEWPGGRGRKTGREFHGENSQALSKAPRSEKGQEVSTAQRLNKTEQTCVQWAWQPATSASADWGVVVGVLGRKRQWVQTVSERGEHGMERTCHDPTHPVLSDPAGG